MKKQILAMTSMLLTSWLVFGQPGDRPMPFSWDRFSAMHDSDGDGQVSQDEFLNHVRDRFAELDQNGDGVITEADFAARQFQMAASRMVSRADADASGTVSAQEWMTFVDGLNVDENGAIDLNQFRGRRAGRGPGGPGFENSCTTLDLNGSGALDRDDLTQIFAALDKNGDQVLDDTELVRPRHSRAGRDGLGRGKRGCGHRGPSGQGRPM